MLVVQRVFRAKRTNLHEKYDYPLFQAHVLPHRAGQALHGLAQVLQRAGVGAVVPVQRGGHGFHQCRFLRVLPLQFLQQGVAFAAALAQQAEEVFVFLAVVAAVHEVLEVVEH